MSTALAVKPETVDAGLVERVLLHGDLRQLSPAQKVSYYKAVCESVGLNPLTQPFQYLVLNGKEILYATRAATEQLRQVHAVSVQIMAREVVEDCYVVTARATLASGRQDENIGAVPIANLKGEARANAMMKAETKAKRRVTLAICGLGMLDETEVASIPGAGYVVTPIAEAPAIPAQGLPDSERGSAIGEAVTSVPNVGDSGRVDMPPGARRIVKVAVGAGSYKAEIIFDAPLPECGESVLRVYRQQLADLAAELCQNNELCFVGLKRSASGNWRVEDLARVPKDYDPPQPASEPLTAADIPFVWLLAILLPAFSGLLA